MAPHNNFQNNHPLNTIIIIITTTTTMIIIVLKTSAAFKVLSMCVRLSLLQLRPLFAYKEKHETKHFDEDIAKI